MREAVGVKAGGLLHLPAGLVLVSRHGSGRDGLVIPKGGIKLEDGNLRRTAERELLEETGYVARATLFLGMVVRGSIDVDSPERRKVINVFLMHGSGERDGSAIPDEEFCLVDPRQAAHGGIMRYSEEAAFLGKHLATILRFQCGVDSPEA